MSSERVRGFDQRPGVALIMHEVLQLELAPNVVGGIRMETVPFGVFGQPQNLTELSWHSEDWSPVLI